MGYREVIETLQWGLAQLGHDVTVAFNTFETDRTNIFFGGQMLSDEQLQTVPPDSIFYQLEQMARVPLDHVRPITRTIASRFRIWEYNQENVDTWLKMNPAFAPQLLPISWSPILRRIPRLDNEDIDVLFYGITSPARLTVFDHLCRSGIKSLYACGLYGPLRDSLISRAKIILNLNFYDACRIFESVRVSYLLANEKAVVSDIYPDSIIDPDLKEAVAWAPLPKIAEEIARLLKDDTARRALAARGRAIIERRDIRANLQRVLGA